jgi:hypothetical protein
MTQKEIKNSYIEFITKLIVHEGGIPPSITVLGTHIKDGLNAVVHIPIPGKFIKDDNSKDEFVNELIPQIAKKVAEDFDINAVAWASEAWLRVSDIKTIDLDKGLSDWKSLPVKMEVLIITIESHDDSEFTVLEIVRSGKQVNEDGDLIDRIELVELPDYDGAVLAEGRFAGLYRKFKEFSADL